MEWQLWGTQLIEVLGLRQMPVGVTYSDEAMTGASTKKCRACGALREAAQGAVIDFTAENSACPGGSQFLGLRAQAPEHACALREFLIHGEKLFASPVAVHHSMTLSKAQPPFAIAAHIIFAPLPQASLAPDLAVFLCNAWQAARLIDLAYYQTGMPMECDPTGALCRAAITYPLVTGQVNMAFGDVTARRSEKSPEDELYVSLPYPHLQSVVASLDGCSAGTAKAEITPGMRKLMKASGGEMPEI